MAKTTPEQNKALVLKAFDTLFNKRDYAAAERFLVRSLHPAQARTSRPAVRDCSTLSALCRRHFATRTN